VAGANTVWPWIRLFGDSLFAVSNLIGPVIALACCVTAWAYQLGSARIGIVDLFACEIGTIYGVFAITDVARRYVEALNIDFHGPPDRQMVERIRTLSVISMRPRTTLQCLIATRQIFASSRSRS
jgi:1,4-dihydroxy-2-naphthoate octaprenyltransferase